MAKGCWWGAQTEITSSLGLNQLVLVMSHVAGIATSALAEGGLWTEDEEPGSREALHTQKQCLLPEIPESI